MNEKSDNSPTPAAEPKKSGKVLIYVVAALAVLLVAALVVNFIRENNVKFS